MIKQIKLKNVASYDDILVQDLKQVNFVFGGNGSGKTTISKLLYNKYVKEVNSNLYMECGVDFASDKFNDYNILVYNDDFVKNHLKSKESIKGIYSVAQQDIETEEKIEKVKKDEDEIQNKIKGVEDKQNDIQKNIDTQKRDFENSCWQHLSTNKQKFDKCFSGFKNNKAAWASKCEEIFSIDKISNDTLDSVEAEYKTVFDTNSKHESIFENINFCLIEELEKEQIFGQAIVPQDSREMNKLIKQLNSSDWVKQGLNYLPKSGDQCPFCQQNITETIKKNIEYIFADEHYKQQKLQFEQARQDYKANIDSLKDMISDITQSNISFINLQNIKLLLSELETIVNSNKTNLDFKNKNLAKVITLQSSKEILVKIKCEIDNFNEQISKHNEVVNNERKKDDIINKVINIIANNLLYDTIKEHKQEIDKFNKQMNEENKRLEALELDLKDIESEIKDLQSKSSNIDDIMDKINKRLKEFGFIGFSFKKCDDGRNYQILRSDGKPVEKTLSEGEHRFVTFLYFYYCCIGKSEEDIVSKPKIIVIDDPISSLDSNIMFVVVSLCKQLIESCKLYNNNLQSKTQEKDKKQPIIKYISQLFFLTHNIAFHHEITFQENEKTKFYILSKKENDKSNIESFDKNPIQTTYQLLWQEVKDCMKGDNKISVVAIQNTMRRILEYYFKTLAGFSNLDKFIQYFQHGEDKIIENSLLKWLHFGSHNIGDDLFYPKSDEDMNKYLQVFEQIFEKAGHKAHYDMMMK